MIEANRTRRERKVTKNGNYRDNFIVFNMNGEDRGLHGHRPVPNRTWSSLFQGPNETGFAFLQTRTGPDFFFPGRVALDFTLPIGLH